MRFVLASVVAAFVVADESCEQREQVAMLQMKDRSGLSKETDLFQAVTQAAQSFGEDTRIENFLNEVKNAVKTLPEPDGAEALLQRASQSEQMQDLIARFQALPQEDQKKLSFAGGGIFNKLPKSQRAALVQQVSHALDEGISGKPKTETKTDKATGQKITETKDSRTGYYHRHSHGKRGTESVSRSKEGGHEHRHSYTHNGKGGNARTETRSKSIQGHEHDHTHQHSIVNGRTQTFSATRSKSADGDVHAHSHNHVHSPDAQTSTNTQSRSNDWGHDHVHNHNERNGNSNTDSDTFNNGRKTWHHGHDHNAATGEWKAHDINGEMNWDWLDDDDHDDHHGHHGGHDDDDHDD